MKQQSLNTVLAKKPDWLRRRLPSGPEVEELKEMLKEFRLHTVCQEAKCPNIWECYSRHTATFLIMGSQCTRNCRFCSIETGLTTPPDPNEHLRVAEVARQMGLKYVVVTSVSRDDLTDGGAGIFARTIREIRCKISDACVEVLIPDFQGNIDALHTVVDARPDIVNHNKELPVALLSAVRIMPKIFLKQ